MNRGKALRFTGGVLGVVGIGTVVFVMFIMGLGCGCSPSLPQAGISVNESVSDNSLEVEVVAVQRGDILVFKGVKIRDGFELDIENQSRVEYTENYTQSSSDSKLVIKNPRRGDRFVLTGESYNQTNQITLVGIYKKPERSYEAVLYTHELNNTGR